MLGATAGGRTHLSCVGRCAVCTKDLKIVRSQIVSEIGRRSIRSVDWEDGQNIATLEGVSDNGCQRLELGRMLDDRVVTNSGSDLSGDSGGWVGLIP
jgi:hypothetical protein